MLEEIDWIHEGVLFVMGFEDPIAKIYEMFPVERDDFTSAESHNDAIESSFRSQISDNSSDTVTNTDDTPQVVSVQQPSPIQNISTNRADTKYISRSQRPSKRGGPRYWCGEEGCTASRMVVAGSHPHVGMAQHYRTHHRELWLDVKRLVAHDGGPQGQRCLPMRVRTECETINSKRGRKPAQEKP